MLEPQSEDVGFEEQALEVWYEPRNVIATFDWIFDVHNVLLSAIYYKKMGNLS